MAPPMYAVRFPDSANKLCTLRKTSGQSATLSTELRL